MDDHDDKRRHWSVKGLGFVSAKFNVFVLKFVQTALEPCLALLPGQLKLQFSLVGLGARLEHTFLPMPGWADWTAMERLWWERKVCVCNVPYQP